MERDVYRPSLIHIIINTPIMQAIAAMKLHAKNISAPVDSVFIIAPYIFISLLYFS